MSSIKRKALDNDLQRRVRVRRESTEEPEPAGSVPTSNGDDPTTEDDNSEANSEDDEVCFLNCSFEICANNCSSQLLRDQRVLMALFQYHSAH